MIKDGIEDNYFSKEELLFIHLLSHNRFRDHYVVSESITEQGIRSALDCDLSLISRILKRNEEKGYIFRSLSKVENKKRKQNAFFLTDEGVRIALELKETKSKLGVNPKINITQHHISEY
jgi:DNA-binding MarR family transcriptional regulator